MAFSIVEQHDTITDVDAEVGALAKRIAGDGLRLPLAAPVVDEAAAREAAGRAVADLIDKQAGVNPVEVVAALLRHIAGHAGGHVPITALTLVIPAG